MAGLGNKAPQIGYPNMVKMCPLCPVPTPSTEQHVAMSCQAVETERTVQRTGRGANLLQSDEWCEDGGRKDDQGGVHGTWSLSVCVVEEMAILLVNLDWKI